MRTSWIHPQKVLAAGALAIAALGLGATGASAASPPIAVTGPPSVVTDTAATLSGNVNPNGVSSSWYFQYGTTTGYGLRTAAESAGSGAKALAASLRVSGLTPGTTYHYRIVATSTVGTGVGLDAAFHTPANAPTILTQSVSGIHDTTAVASAVLNPNGLATTFYVRYGPSTAYGLTTAIASAGSGISDTTVSVTLPKLVSHTTYDFAFVATNAAGTTVGPNATFLTIGVPAIASESIRSLAPTTATLMGTVVPDGHRTTWYFQYGTTSSYGINTAAGDAGSGTAVVAVAKAISGLVPNTTYHFRLVATNAIGTTVGGDTELTTPGPSLNASVGNVTYGSTLMLSGTIPNGLPNESVSLYGQSVTDASFVQLATLLTGNGGAWSYGVAPHIQTTYKVIWTSEVSPQVTIGVNPSVTFRTHNGGIVGHVSAGQSFAGRMLRLERYVHGSWHTTSNRSLNGSSSVTFHPNLPSGRWQLRLFFTSYQAGTGYLSSSSAIHLFRVR